MIKNNICIYCNSCFYHKPNLDLHYTYCKYKPRKSVFYKFWNIFNCNITL